MVYINNKTSSYIYIYIYIYFIIISCRSLVDMIVDAHNNFILVFSIICLLFLFF
jgi:hypothetical protein